MILENIIFKNKTTKYFKVHKHIEQLVIHRTIKECLFVFYHMVGTALLQPVLDLYTVIKIYVYYKHLSFIVIFQTLKVSTNNTIMVKKCIFNVYVNYAKTWPLDVA